MHDPRDYRRTQGNCPDAGCTVAFDHVHGEDSITLDTPRLQLFELHHRMTREAFQLMEKKNEDYANSTDPLKNFRKRGLLGMLVRLEDKLARLDTFVERGTLSVKDETIDDTLRDAINYLVLIQYAINELKKR